MAELKKILHIDDEDDIREVVQMTLEALGGFSVTSISSGQEALDRVLDIEPDLVIIDVMMPGMDGPTTFKALQENSATAAIPAIFMTAKVQSHEIDEYLKLGSAGVITKPFDPMSLPEDVIKIWKQVNES